MNEFLFPVTTLSHRLLAVLLLVTVALSGYFLGISPLLQRYFALDDEVNSVAFRLGHTRSALDHALAIDLGGHNAAPRADLYFVDTSVDVATSKFQAELQAVATRSKLSISSMRIARSDAENGLTTLNANVRLTGSLAAVKALLYALDTSVPIVRVEHIQMQPLIDALPGADSIGKLDVGLDLVAYSGPF